jgi:hypothetical protein
MLVHKSQASLTNTVTAGSRTHPKSATGGSAEDLTRRSSHSSISGQSSFINDTGEFYGNVAAERMGSSTRSFFHFTGRRSQESFEGSSAGHTPFVNGTPSRTPLMTPVVTPRVEVEGMSWETHPVPPIKAPKPTSKALHGILKPRGPRKEEPPATQMDHDKQLHHHPSVCESCKQEIGVPLSRSASRDISEAIARLQAEKMAAEVEASRSTDQPVTHRSPLSEKSLADAMHNKTEPVKKTPTQSAKEGIASVQEKTRQVPTTLSTRSSVSLASSVQERELEEPTHTQSLTRAASTIHLNNVEPNVPKAESPTDAIVSNVPLNQPTTNQPLAYNSGAKSMPALPTRSTPHSDQPSRFHEIMSNEPEETPTIVRPAEDTQSLAMPKTKHRFHWRRLMGFRKPKSKPNKHQQ